MGHVQAEIGISESETVAGFGNPDRSFQRYIRRYQLLFRASRDAAISIITRAEVLTGFEPRAARKAIQFLVCVATLGIDQAIADLAATLRRAQ
jgi:hypothetical protein